MSKFPDIVYEKTNVFIEDSLVKTPRMGVIINNLNNNEIVYKFIRNSNQEMRLGDIEISCFSSDKSVPVITPLFPIYSITQITGYSGPIVATDLATWQMSQNNYASKRYLYLYDIGYLSKIPKELVQKVNDSDYVIFSHTDKHNQYLKKLGFNVSNFTVKNFNIRQMDFIWQKHQKNLK